MPYYIRISNHLINPYHVLFLFVLQIYQKTITWRLLTGQYFREKHLKMCLEGKNKETGLSIEPWLDHLSILIFGVNPSMIARIKLKFAFRTFQKLISSLIIICLEQNAVNKINIFIHLICLLPSLVDHWEMICLAVKWKLI